MITNERSAISARTPCAAIAGVMRMFIRLSALGIALILATSITALAQTSTDASQATQVQLAVADRAVKANKEEASSQEPQKQQSKPMWNYGAFVDAGYLLDFNHPANQIFRSRGTAWHVDDVYLNMA